MTRLLFRSTLAALCLTAVTVGSARSDNWFSSWGRKKTAADSENSAPAELVSEESDDDAAPTTDADDENVGMRQRVRTYGDNCRTDFNERRLHAIETVNMKHAEHKARRQMRRDNRQVRRDSRGGYGGYGGGYGGHSYGYGAYPAPCHPQLNSSLYPCPRPDVPQEVGSTIITNQAFYPHEMLYGHQYRAIYPPFYYENKCGITCLPFVPRPCIAGTVVSVKYKTCLPCSFHPPVGDVCGLTYPWAAAGQANFNCH